MSVQSALRFIRQVQNDKGLRTRVQALGQEADLESLVQIGMDAQLEFTADELQVAFKHDWAMRWVHYDSPTTPKIND